MQRLTALALILIAACSGGHRGAATPTPVAPPADAAAPAPPAAAAGPCNTAAACATACEARDALGCRRLGLFVITYDVDRYASDQLLAITRASCDAGVSSACGTAGAYLRQQVRARSVPRDVARAYEIEAASRLAEACTGGEARACGLLADDDGDDPTAAEHRAREQDLLIAACAAGDGGACGDRAHYLDAQSLEGDGRRPEEADVDYQRAAASLQRACDAGDALACYDLADDYTNDGYAVETDLDQSSALAQRACSLSPPLCPAGSSPAPLADASDLPTTIRIGDPVDTVRAVYALTALPDPTGYPAGGGQYHLTDAGLWFFFDAGRVKTIRLDRGGVDGVYVGDPEAKLRRVRGEPLHVFNDGTALMYDSTAYGRARFDLDAAGGKVVDILLMQ